MKDLYSFGFFDTARIISAVSREVFGVSVFDFGNTEESGGSLAELIAAALRELAPGTDHVRIVSDFLGAIPEIKRLLYLDAESILSSDPAADDIREVICAYPGFFAIFCHRTANLFYKMSVPALPRFISEYAHSRTGIDIHPGAEIGERFSIDHGTGIVIGETAVIGDRVRLYQGVTIGAKSFPRNDKGEFDRTVKRHPTIGNGVVIYASAAIFGADTVIGDGAVIGANVRIAHSVEPYARVYCEK